MSDREVMQQAFDALQRARNQVVQLGRLCEVTPDTKEVSNAIEALRAALAEPESDEWIPCPWCGEMKSRAALAEPVQEPIPLNDGRLWQYPDGSIGIGKLAEPVQEPVAPTRRPLTDEEINRINKSIHPDMMLPDAKRLFARLIERAHGITGGNDE